MSNTKKFTVVLSEMDLEYPYDGSMISLAATVNFKVCDLNLKDEEIILKLLKPEGLPFSFKLKSNEEVNLSETARLEGNFIGAQFTSLNLDKEVRFSYELTYI